MIHADPTTWPLDELLDEIAAMRSLRDQRADAELAHFLLTAADDAAMQLAGEAPRRKPTNRELPDDTDEART